MKIEIQCHGSSRLETSDGSRVFPLRVMIFSLSTPIRTARATLEAHDEDGSRSRSRLGGLDGDAIVSQGNIQAPQDPGCLLAVERYDS